MNNCPGYLEVASNNIRPSGYIKCYFTGCVNPEEEVAWHELHIDICKPGEATDRYTFNLSFSQREAIVNLLEPTADEYNAERMGP